MELSFEKVVWILAGIMFLPALAAAGGFIVAAVAAFLILSGYYATRYGLRVYEQQNVGKRAGRFDLNSTLQGSDDEDWGRE